MSTAAAFPRVAFELRSPAAAIVWELWRLSRWELAGRIGLQSVWWLGAFAYLGGNNPEADALSGVVLLMLIAGSFLSWPFTNSFENRRKGFSFYLAFARPVSTSVLVLVPVAFLAVTTAAAYLVPASLLRAVFGIPFPLLSGASMLVLAATLGVSGYWSFRSPTAKAAGTVLAGFVWSVLVYSFFGRHVIYNVFNTVPSEWLPGLVLSPAQYGFVSLLSIGATALAIFSATRQRREDALFDFRSEFFGQLKRRLGVVRLSNVLNWRCPVDSWARAQFWYEMRRGGCYVVLCTAAITIVITVLSLTFFNAGSVHEAIPIWQLFIVFYLPVQLLVGVELVLGRERSPGVSVLRQFDVIRPAASSKITAVKLVSIWFSGLAGLALLVGGAAFWTAVTDAQSEWNPKFETLEEKLGVGKIHLAKLICFALVHYVVASFLVMGLELYRNLYPRRALVTILVFYTYVAFVGGILFLDPPPTATRWLLELNGWAVAALLAYACGRVWRLALSRGVLRPPHVAKAVVCWVAYLAFMAWTTYAHYGNIAAYFHIPIGLVLSALTIPLTAVAVAPLAFDSHRHR